MNDQGGILHRKKSPPTKVLAMPWPTWEKDLKLTGEAPWSKGWKLLPTLSSVVVYSARLHCKLHTKFSHGTVGRYRNSCFLSKPYQTPIRPQSFWVCSINFCRTRCGMTLRDLSRPNRIVEAGQDVMLSCLGLCLRILKTDMFLHTKRSKTICIALVVNVCCKAIPRILIIQYSQYTVYNLKNLRCLQTLLTCTWWYCIGLDREATSSFVLEEHRTIIQILVERGSKHHHRCHHFHRTFLVSLFFFSLYYLYVSINCKSYKNSYRGDVHQSYWHHYSTVLSKIVILDLTPCRALHEHGHKLQGYRHVVVSQSVGAHAPRAQIKRRLVAGFCFIWLCGIFGMCEDWRTGCVHADVLCFFCPPPEVLALHRIMRCLRCKESHGVSFPSIPC